MALRGTLAAAQTVASLAALKNSKPTSLLGSAESPLDSAAVAKALQDLAEATSSDTGRRAVVTALTLLPGALENLLVMIKVLASFATFTGPSNPSYSSLSECSSSTCATPVGMRVHSPSLYLRYHLYLFRDDLQPSASICKTASAWLYMPCHEFRADSLSLPHRRPSGRTQMGSRRQKGTDGGRQPGVRCACMRCACSQP